MKTTLLIYLTSLLFLVTSVTAQHQENNEYSNNNISLNLGGLAYSPYQGSVNVKYFMSINKQFSKFKNPQILVYAQFAKRRLPFGNLNIQFLGIGNSFNFRQGKKLQFHITPGFMFNNVSTYLDNWTLYGLGGYLYLSLGYQFKKINIGFGSISYGSFGKSYQTNYSNQAPKKYGSFVDLISPILNIKINL